MMEEKIKFKNNRHREHFEELMAQGEGELNARQIAFVYLIAMYQDDYMQYEGMPFFIEVYEEVSIDGPVYLLEDCVDLRTYDHERILIYAKSILRGEPIGQEEVPVEFQSLVGVAENLRKAN